MPPFSPSQLAVIVVSYNSHSTIAATLQSLAAQSVSGFEVLVADSSSDATPSLIASRFPHVRLLTSPHRLFPGAARNLALRHTAAPLIAFLDSDCLAAPDFVERILAAHSRPDLIIGGSVGVANPQSIPGWASFFTEFTPWLPAGHERHLPDIPTCCLSCKREAFLLFGPFLESSYCSDTLFNARASAAGSPPLFLPDIHVRHTNPTCLRRQWAKFFDHGRAYASVRNRHANFPPLHLLLRSLSAPLLPLVLFTRILARAAAAPGFRLPLLKSFPLLALNLCCWSAGEAAGYGRALAAR